MVQFPRKTRLFPLFLSGWCLKKINTSQPPLNNKYSLILSRKAVIGHAFGEGLKKEAVQEQHPIK